MTRKKAVRGKPGPKPGFMPAVNQRRAKAKLEAITDGALVAMTVPSESDAEYVAGVRRNPLKYCKYVRFMQHAELRLLARGLNVPEHNIVELTEERLRQNCMMQASALIEAIAGD